MPDYRVPENGGDAGDEDDGDGNNDVINDNNIGMVIRY